MAKSILTFNDGTNNYILKFGTNTTTLKTGLGRISATYLSSQISDGTYYYHSFSESSYTYDLTTISGIANAAQFEVKEVYYNDNSGKKSITDYTVLETALTINRVPSYCSNSSSEGAVTIFINVEYISGGYKIISTSL